MDEPDDFDIQHIDHEQAQEIIDWAIMAASMIVLMETAKELEPDNLVRLEGYHDAIQIMLDGMPDHLKYTAAEVATETMQDIDEEETMVAEFRQELDEL